MLPTPPPPPVTTSFDVEPLRVEMIKEPESPELPLPPPPTSLNAPSPPLIDEFSDEIEKMASTDIQETQIGIKPFKLPSLLSDFEKFENEDGNLASGFTVIGARRRVSD